MSQQQFPIMKYAALHEGMRWFFGELPTGIAMSSKRNKKGLYDDEEFQIEELFAVTAIVFKKENNISDSDWR